MRAEKKAKKQQKEQKKKTKAASPKKTLRVKAATKKVPLVGRKRTHMQTR